MRKPMFVGRGSRRGFVLIDGLIAIVVFSIGILGMVSLQSAAVKMSTDAKYRTDAAMFADQIVAQMWGSDQTALATQFVGAGGTGGAAYTAWAGNVMDITKSGLPGAAAAPPSVTVDATNLVTVTINWSAPNDSSAHQYVSITQIAP